MRTHRNHTLRGVIAANQASVYKMLLTDNRRPNGTTYDPTLLALAGIDEDKLAPLVEIAPNAFHPVLNATAATLLSRRDPVGQGVRMFARRPVSGGGCPR